MQTPDRWDAHALASRFHAGAALLAVPQRQLPKGTFSTVGFMRSLDLAHMPPLHRDGLDRLAKKVEVVRRVDDFYANGWLPHADARPVEPPVLTSIHLLFAAAGIASGDFKWVNTALKMCDGICGTDWSQGEGVCESLRAFLEEHP
jgi:hypothetical protein